MRPFLATLLSLLTLTGGHYLNRRWDRAALFFGLLFVGLILIYAALAIQPAGFKPEGVYLTLETIQSRMRVLLAGLALLPVLSAWVTWRDSRAVLPMLPWQGILPILGAVLMTVFSLLLMAYVAVWASSYLSMARDAVAVSGHHAGDAPADRLSSQQLSDFNVGMHFQNVLYFGGRDFSRGEAKPVPTGSAYLVGQVLFNGEPVERAQVRVMINSAYAQDSVRTDAEGRYVVRVPPGTWSVNEIHIDAWPDMPRAGGYMLMSAAEAPGALDRERYPLFLETGLQVETTDSPVLNPDLVVHIRPTLELHWPPAQEEPVIAQVDSAALHWSEYPGATHYQVKISEVTRHGSTTAYRPVVREVVSGAVLLPLANLATVTDDTAVREYAVEVIAMREDGTFLSETRQTHLRPSFRFSDGRRLLGNDKRRLLEQGTSPSDIQALFKNDARLDAAVILIREDMLAPAETLLDKIDTASPGRKLAVTGYLRARQARCDEAASLLTQAKAEGGSLCVPAEYWAGCRTAE